MSTIYAQPCICTRPPTTGRRALAGAFALSVPMLLSGCFSPDSQETTDAGTDGSSGVPSVESSTPEPGTQTGTSGNPPVTDTDSDAQTNSTRGTEETTAATTADDTSSSSGETPPTSVCDGTWNSWLTAEFDYLDGGVLGTTDFPNTPWGTVQGAATIANGELVSVGDSVSVASHGAPIELDGARLRFSVTFNDSDNEVAVAFNGNFAGEPGLGVRVRASDGRIAVLDAGVEAETDTIGALELGVPYFIEVEAADGSAHISLSQINYGLVPGSMIEAALLSVPITDGSRGRYTIAQLVDGGPSPSIDAIEVARCGLEAPAHEVVFEDSFNRPNSELLGSPNFPAGSLWNGDGNADNVDISANRANFTGFNVSPTAVASASIGNTHARMRSVVRFINPNSWPRVLWAVDSTPSIAEGDLGFDLWNNGNERRIILHGFNGHVETPFADGPFVPGVDYYVEVAVDASLAVATVRTDSFTGPVFAATAADNVGTPGAAVTRNRVSVGSLSIGGGRIDSLELAQYQP